MKKSDFVKTDGFFETEIDGIKIVINENEENKENELSDEAVQFAEKVLLAYPQKIAVIVEHISKDELISPYQLTKEQIAAKLHKPDILIYDGGGQLSYCENEIDLDHILDIEFSGVLETFYEVTMDG
jgi:hypothetical protein